MWGGRSFLFVSLRAFQPEYWFTKTITIPCIYPTSSYYYNPKAMATPTNSNPETVQPVIFSIVSIGYVLFSIGVLIIITRLVLRHLKNEPYEPDDYVMLGSVVFYTLLTVTSDLDVSADPSALSMVARGLNEIGIVQTRLKSECDGS